MGPKIEYASGHPRAGSPGAMEELFEKTDWQLFHRQKQSLLTILELSPHSLGHDFDIPEKDAALILEHLSGILNLMDSFMDVASDILGIEAATPPPCDEGEGEESDA